MAAIAVLCFPSTLCDQQGVTEDSARPSLWCAGSARLANQGLVLAPGQDMHPLPHTSTSITVSAVPPQQSTSSSRHVPQVVAASLPGLRHRLRARGVLLFFCQTLRTSCPHGGFPLRNNIDQQLISGKGFVTHGVEIPFLLPLSVGSCIACCGRQKVML